MIHDGAMAEAVGIDPEGQAQMARLYEAQPSLFQDLGGSSDSSEDEGHGRTTPQPETVAALACLEPGCKRYFGPCCHYLLRVWHPGFFLRHLLCKWADFAQEEYGRRCFEGSAEGRREKASAAAASST